MTAPLQHPKSARGHDERWWHRATGYQVYPRSFLDTTGSGVGDLPGITRKLDYVASLGVDAVWLSPFYPSPMADFGYDVTAHCEVDPLYGTMNDFDALVERAHDLGLKVVIDAVLNHTSDQHEWFEERRHVLEELRRNALIEDDGSTRLYPEDAQWAQTLHDAREAEEPVLQRKLLQEAVSQGARDPWPYESLVKFYIKIHEYEAARRVCETYFETDIWRAARWADSSMRLLRLMGKLERKLFTTV